MLSGRRPRAYPLAQQRPSLSWILLIIGSISCVYMLFGFALTSHPVDMGYETIPLPTDQANTTPFSDEVIPNNGSKFIVLIDCGSSGSRLYVYEVATVPKLEVTLLSKPLKVFPGISDLSPEESFASLSKLIQTALPYFEDPDESSLFILATGGMRALPAGESRTIMKSLEDLIVSSYGEIFDNAHVSVLAGSMEGVYAWLGVNIQLDIIDPKCSLHLSEAKVPVGILEIGGASAQVTLHVNEEQATHKVIIGKCTEHSLYSVSFDNLGNRHARASYDSYIGTSQDPCRDRSGYSSCSVSVNSSFCDTMCIPNESAFSSLDDYIKASGIQFYGMGDVYYVLDTLHSYYYEEAVHPFSGDFSPTSFQYLTQEYCADPNIVQTDEDLCFRSAWLQYFLQQTVGFTDLQLHSQIGSAWPLGYVILESVGYIQVLE